mmetsp:Transcript_6057/g.15446  ORF Transcript_6057/g.15446 Transcript_6057/m.15446 type:complete len:225 (-) Transcript_6057:2167-2841(-)
MRKNAHDFGKAVRLEHIQKLKGFHFKAKLGVHHQQYQIGNLGAVQHGRRVVGALKERNTLVLSGHHCNGPCDGCQVVIGVGFDQRSDQGGFSNAARTHYDHRAGRYLVSHSRPAIRERDILLLLRSIEIPLNISLGSTNVGHAKGSNIVSFDASSLFFGSLVLLLFLGTAPRLSGLVLVMLDLSVTFHGLLYDKSPGQANEWGWLQFFSSKFCWLKPHAYDGKT